MTLPPRLLEINNGPGIETACFLYMLQRSPVNFSLSKKNSNVLHVVASFKQFHQNREPYICIFFDLRFYSRSSSLVVLSIENI